MEETMLYTADVKYIPTTISTQATYAARTPEPVGPFVLALGTSESSKYLNARAGCAGAINLSFESGRGLSSSAFASNIFSRFASLLFRNHHAPAPMNIRTAMTTHTAIPAFAPAERPTLARREEDYLAMSGGQDIERRGNQSLW
jgi:hypothetical protein